MFWEGRCWSTETTSLLEALPMAKREIDKLPSPLFCLFFFLMYFFHCLFSLSPGIPTGSSKASIVFRYLLSPDTERAGSGPESK